MSTLYSLVSRRVFSLVVSFNITSKLFLFQLLSHDSFLPCKGNQTYHDKSDQLNQFLCMYLKSEWKICTLWKHFVWNSLTSVPPRPIQRVSDIYNLWSAVSFGIGSGESKQYDADQWKSANLHQQSLEILPDLLKVEDGRPSPPDKGSSHPDKMLPQRYPQVIT